MLSKDFAMAYLRAVEKKNNEYFTSNNLTILECIKIKGIKLISVHITKSDLPEDIKYQIETMFWLE